MNRGVGMREMRREQRILVRGESDTSTGMEAGAVLVLAGNGGVLLGLVSFGRILAARRIVSLLRTVSDPCHPLRHVASHWRQKLGQLREDWIPGEVLLPQYAHPTERFLLLRS